MVKDYKALDFALGMLRKAPRTIPELAAATGYNWRTIYRFFDYYRQQGISVVRGPGNRRDEIRFSLEK